MTDTNRRDGARRKLVARAVIVAALLASRPTMASNCEAILQLGYDNVRDSVSVDAMRAVAFNYFCSSESTSTQSGQSKGLQISYATWSGKADASDQEIRDAQKTACAQSSSEYQKYGFIETHAREIHQGAIDAWTRCKELENHGLQVDINPDLQKASVTVSMRWTGVGSAFFEGLKIASDGKVHCTGPGNAEPKDRFQLSTNMSIFTCTRDFKPDTKGGASAKYARIVFATSDGPAIVDLPPITLVEVEQSELAALAEHLRAQKQQLDSLTAALNAFQKPRSVRSESCEPPKGLKDRSAMLGCLAKCKDDEIGIGGLCFVDEGGGPAVLQNAGMNPDNWYSCVFSGRGNGKEIKAHALVWCVKRPK